MHLLYRTAACLVALGFALYPLLAHTYSGGAPPGFTGAPGDNGVCQDCHASFPLDDPAGNGSVSVEAPETFMPGEIYTFTVTVVNNTPPVGTSLQGFQLTVKDENAEHVGDLVVTDVTNTQYADPPPKGVFCGEEDDICRYVTHTTAGNQQTTWTMEWVAPVDAPETATVYVAGNAADGNFIPTGDYVYTASVTMQRSSVDNEPGATPLAARLHSIYPNPVAGRALVEFELEQAQPVTLTLLDGRGRRVQTHALGVQPAGRQTAALDATGLAGGVYFVEVQTPEGADTRPVTVLR